MNNYLNIINNAFTKVAWILLLVLWSSNIAFSFQSIPTENYIKSEIVEKKFDESVWKNAIEGIDYSNAAPKKEKADEPDVEDEEDGRVYEDEAYTPPPDMGKFWRGFFKFFLIALAVIVLAFIIANMVGAEGWSLAPSNRKVEKSKASIPITLENVEDNIYESDLDRFIREALDKENYTQAVRLYYLAIIKELSLKKWVKWKKDKTNRDYIRELSNTAFQGGFRNVTNVFERVWYGKQDLGSNDFKGSVQPQLKDLLQESQKRQQKSISMKDKRPFIILGIAAVVLLLLFVFIGGGSTRFDWSENYEAESKDPYGSFVIHEMLKDYFPANTLTDISDGIKEELPLAGEVKSNYVFIGESMFLDSADVTTLLSFVNEGNNAFISSKTIPFDLMFELYFEECNFEPWDEYEGYTDTIAVFNFVHEQLKKEKGYAYKFLEQKKTLEYQWNFIDSLYFCNEPYSFIKLGTLSGNRANFVKKEYGGGAFYLHTTPLNFTNFQLLDKVGVEYANNVFSHLDEGNIYWDEYSRVGEGFGRAYNRRRSGGGSRSISSEESLKYILAQPSLAWAWYLALSMGLLYLFFRAKRKQRIIPVLEQNENTSFEFISTIGRLYFLQNDHKKLCSQKMKLFLSYIRDRYNLNTTSTNDEFKKKLVAKSEIAPSVINNIFSFYKNIDTSPFVSEQTLTEFHQKMDEFYKNCK